MCISFTIYTLPNPGKYLSNQLDAVTTSHNTFQTYYIYIMVEHAVHIKQNNLQIYQINK